MESSRSQRIGEILLNKKLILPKVKYKLSEIYKIIEENAVLFEEDWGEEENGDIKWQHTTRRLIQEWDNKRSVLSKREVTHYGNSEYSFQ